MAERHSLKREESHSGRRLSVFLPRPRCLDEIARFTRRPNFAPKMSSAVDVQGLARDKAATRTANEHSSLGDLPRVAGATHRVRLRITRAYVFGVCAPTLRDDSARCYTVHPDPERRPFDCDRLTECDDASTRGAC